MVRGNAENGGGGKEEEKAERGKEGERCGVLISKNTKKRYDIRDVCLGNEGSGEEKQTVLQSSRRRKESKGTKGVESINRNNYYTLLTGKNSVAGVAHVSAATLTTVGRAGSGFVALVVVVMFTASASASAFVSASESGTRRVRAVAGGGGGRARSCCRSCRSCCCGGCGCCRREGESGEAWVWKWRPGLGGGRARRRRRSMVACEV